MEDSYHVTCDKSYSSMDDHGMNLSSDGDFHPANHSIDVLLLQPLIRLGVPIYQEFLQVFVLIIDIVVNQKKLKQD